MNQDITSANATAILTVDGLYPAGFPLLMFGADAALNQDTVQVTDTRMGVDGFMVAGYTPSIKVVTITLEAASPSRTYLMNYWRAMETARKPFKCTLVCTLPAIFAVYTWTDGVLREGSSFPSMAQLLEPTTWTFHFANLKHAGL